MGDGFPRTLQRVDRDRKESAPRGTPDVGGPASSNRAALLEKGPRSRVRTPLIKRIPLRDPKAYSRPAQVARPLPSSSSPPSPSSFFIFLSFVAFQSLVDRCGFGHEFRSTFPTHYGAGRIRAAQPARHRRRPWFRFRPVAWDDSFAVHRSNGAPSPYGSYALFSAQF
jgi:hypothetical protein